MCAYGYHSVFGGADIKVVYSSEMAGYFIVTIIYSRHTRIYVRKVMHCISLTDNFISNGIL